MKKLLTAMTLTAALTIGATAAEGDHKPEDAPAKKKPTLSAEQKALKKELTEKYDTNKNNRLDKEERSKMTPEDAKKWESVSPAPNAKPAAGEKKDEKKP
jgi:GH35 family endo-1,4-beta-xylanase